MLKYIFKDMGLTAWDPEFAAAIMEQNAAKAIVKRWFIVKRWLEHIDACVKGMEYYIRSPDVVASQGAFIVLRWLEHIKCTT